MVTSDIKELTIAVVIGLGILMTAVLASIKTRERRRYRRSEYRSETRRSRKKLQGDKGAEGEYETSIALEKIRGKKRFVFNAYIPKKNGKGDIETDIIMIHEKGIFVIENKNYSGTVWGRGDREYWNQFLSGRRYTFYNPVYQNLNHIRHIKAFLEKNLPELENLPVFSAVVFNDKTRLRRIRRLKRTDVIVCRCRKVPGKIKKRLRFQPIVFDEKEIGEIYQLLKDNADVFRWVKRSHIKKVEKYKKCLTK